MASLCLNSLPLPPPSQPRKPVETTSLSSLTSNGHVRGEALKPIVVTGNPPTYVSAPGRRIVAGSAFYFLFICSGFFNGFASKLGFEI